MCVKTVDITQVYLAGVPGRKGNAVLLVEKELECTRGTVQEIHVLAKAPSLQGALLKSAQVNQLALF